MADILKFAGPIVIAHGLVFAAIVLGIRKLALNAARQAVETVRQAEREVRKKESAILRQIEEHDQTFARQQAEAQEAMERKRQQTETDLAQMREKLLEDAKTESRRILDQARQNEQQMRQKLEVEVASRAVEQAGKMIEMVFSDPTIAALNHGLLDELIEELDQTNTDGITVEADTVMLKTAQPLDDNHRRRLETLMKEKFSADAVIEEQVDPSLLGGLAFKLGSLEIDGSLKNRLREAQAAIRKQA